MSDMLSNGHVAIVKEKSRYARQSPFHPSEEFPEWPGAVVGSEDNPVYRGVRRLFHVLGFDTIRFGTPEWNPLGDLIKPGNTVLLKPNFVSHRRLRNATGREDDADSLVTHGSVIRAVLDYTGKALRGQGRIILGDCPLQTTDWSLLLDTVGAGGIQEHFGRAFPGCQLKVRDYRLATARRIGGVIFRSGCFDSPLADYLEVELGKKSLLHPITGPVPFGVTDYAAENLQRAHTQESHRFIVPRDFLLADVVINLPKLKTHCKAGITCAMKNLVGVNGHKDYLPHFRYGSSRSGGDEYPYRGALCELRWALAHRAWEHDGGVVKVGLNAMTKVVALAMFLMGVPLRELKSIGGGAWHGNDTLWRTVLDVNRAFFYFDRRNLVMGDAPSRDLRFLAIVDGIIGGEGESPLSPDPVSAGLLLGAGNPVALDAVATAIMGFDWRKIPQIANAFTLAALPLTTVPPENIEISYDGHGRVHLEDIYTQRMYVPFKASEGYRSHVEYRPLEQTPGTSGARIGESGRTA